MATPKECFTFSSDKNNTFNVEIKNESNAISVYAVYKGEIQSKEYAKTFSLNDLKTNKYLSFLESITEIYEEIINIINQRKEEVKIAEETSQITIHIPLERLRVKEIELSLNEKQKNEKEQINDLYKIISDLKNNQKKLEEKIKELELNNNQQKQKQEEKINNLENEINSLKEFKEKIDKKEKEKNENKKIRNMDSLVLGDNEKYNMTIKNWINPNLKIKAQLLYRLSRDGKEYQTFHNLCDNKGNTLTIFKLNDGNILGGYTTKDWDNSKQWKQDQKAFVFSLNENVKCVPNCDAIFCNHNYGPYFEAIRFCSKKMDEPYITTSSYYNDSNRLYPGKNGDYYKCQEVEVFKIFIN